MPKKKFEPRANQKGEDAWVELEPPPLDYEDTWQPGAVESLKKMHRVKSAAELHPSLSFIDAAVVWPSPSFGVVTAEVLEYLHQARANFISNGFEVSDDPVNHLGDGKSWALLCEPTDISESPDRLEIARQCQSECVKGAPRPFWDSGRIIVPLWRSAVVNAEKRREFRSELRQKIEIYLRDNRTATNRDISRYLHENWPGLIPVEWAANEKLASDTYTKVRRALGISKKKDKKLVKPPLDPPSTRASSQ
jgi:hypothetical protein